MGGADLLLLFTQGEPSPPVPPPPQIPPYTGFPDTQCTIRNTKGGFTWHPQSDCPGVIV